MSKSKQYIPPFAHLNETMSFGAHRHADRPASAIRSGASSMPSAWQSRMTPTHPTALHSDQSVRSYANIIKATLTRCYTTRTGQIITSIGAAFALAALLA